MQHNQTTSCYDSVPGSCDPSHDRKGVFSSYRHRFSKVRFLTDAAR